MVGGACKARAQHNKEELEIVNTGDKWRRQRQRMKRWKNEKMRAPMR
jgi:hypothetical protein